MTVADTRKKALEDANRDVVAALLRGERAMVSSPDGNVMMDRTGTDDEKDAAEQFLRKYGHLVVRITRKEAKEIRREYNSWIDTGDQKKFPGGLTQEDYMDKLRLADSVLGGSHE